MSSLASTPKFHGFIFWNTLLRRYAATGSEGYLTVRLRRTEAAGRSALPFGHFSNFDLRDGREA